MSLLFENKTCHRCNGKGTFRCYSHVNAGRCFKCGGSGALLTKRGAEAQAFFDELKHEQLRNLEVGDIVFEEGISAGSFHMPSSWAKIVSIEPANEGHQRAGEILWTVTTQTGRVDKKTGEWVPKGRQDTVGAAYGCEPSAGVSHVAVPVDHEFRVAMSGSDRKFYKAEALRYQDCLTKKGEVSKR